MTIAADIATIGSYHTTDISNAVTQAFKLLTPYYSGTLSEGNDTDWDVIAQVFAIHLLDRLDLQERSKTDPSIQVPPLFSEDVHRMINALRKEADDDSLLVTSYSPSNATFTTTTSNRYYSPGG